MINSLGHASGLTAGVQCTPSLTLAANIPNLTTRSARQGGSPREGSSLRGASPDAPALSWTNVQNRTASVAGAYYDLCESCIHPTRSLRLNYCDVIEV